MYLLRDYLFSVAKIPTGDTTAINNADGFNRGAWPDLPLATNRCLFCGANVKCYNHYLSRHCRWRDRRKGASDVDVCLSLKHDTTAEARKYKKDKIRKWMKNPNITENVVCIFCDEISVAKTCQLDTSDINSDKLSHHLLWCDSEGEIMTRSTPVTKTPAKNVASFCDEIQVIVVGPGDVFDNRIKTRNQHALHHAISARLERWQPKKSYKSSLKYQLNKNHEDINVKSWEIPP